MPRIYFDHNATTPLHPSVLAAMTGAAAHHFGNPSSLHEEGRAARQLVERARAEIAALINATPPDLVFTSGGTESNHSAIVCAARAAARARGQKGQVISSPLEHPSVRAAVDQLGDEGFAVRRLPVDSRGRIDPADLARALDETPTTLVTLALCNHELGNLYPIAALCELSHRHGAFFHCDAVQAVGRVPVDVAALDVDLLSLSAHKLFGPKGIGALFVRSATKPKAGLPALPTSEPLPSLLRGGSQEKGRRAGTENVLGIVGFGAAAALCRRELLLRAPEVAALRDDFETRLLTIPGARRHGDIEPGARAPGTSNMAFDGVEGELLFMNLDLRGIAVSTGAACSSGSPEPSPVLLALGFSRRQALEAVRFSLGAATTRHEVETVAAAVTESVELVRKSSTN